MPSISLPLIGNIEYSSGIAEVLPESALSVSAGVDAQAETGAVFTKPEFNDLIC